MSVTELEIADAVRALGVQPGDLLLVHSSLSSFGHVEGGAEAAARAFARSTAPGGSTFVPTFNYGQAVYDAQTTPSVTGAITEAFWRLPGAQRSLQCTHPVSGIGAEAAEILADHDRADPFGPGSPLWRLYERSAWVLLAGCDHRSSSMIHVAEEVVRVPYLDRTRTGRAVVNGVQVELVVRRPGCSAGFNAVDAVMRERNAILEGTVGNSKLMLIRANPLVEAACDLLAKDITALLCGRRECEVCTQAVNMIADTRSGE